jgi:alpha-beta hydrolase superfamily lysophospholipase
MRTPPLTRISTRFSADGSLAACLVGDGDAWDAEVWSFAADADRHRILATPGGETIFTQLLPLPGERALLIRHGRREHVLVGLDAAGRQTRLTGMACVDTPAFRLLPGRGRHGPALAMSWSNASVTTVWQVLPQAPWLQPLAEVPGRLRGGTALDVHGDHLGGTLDDGGDPRAVRVHLGTGRVEPVPGRRSPGASHLLLAEPVSGLAMLAAETAQGLQLCYAHRDGRVEFPTALPGIEGTVLPLAIAPGGAAVALQVRRGVRTHLLLHHLAADEVSEVDIPAGTIGGTAAWSETGLRFPFTCPSAPGAIATLTGLLGTTAPSWRVAGPDPAPAGRPRPAAHVESFTGLAGPVEAVCYGDWRRAERVLVALHGGPDAAWELDHNTLFAALASRGVAVVAPNQRGSTGYGQAHAAAIHHAWGGPDLDDIDHIGQILARQRPAGAPGPALYGESYGAYLALLACGHRPRIWSRCATVAPFLSGSRLHDEASAEIRELVDRLGGRTPLPGHAGDVLAVADRIRVPLLVVHGDADPTVPVSQSRHLRSHLRRADRPEPADLTYLEVPGADHDPLTGAGGDALTETLVGFLACSPPSRAWPPRHGEPHCDRKESER